MNRRTLLVATVCALLTPAAPGGQAPASVQQRPTFRAETRGIEVDAVVTDLDGRFVRDLTREDFELLEDGQPQEIAAFSLVDVPIDAPAPQPKGSKPGLPTVESDVTTNSLQGRIYVMLLDSPGVRVSARAHVSMEQMFRYTQTAATRFVEEALGPNDLMAVIHVQDWRSDAQSLTSNKSLLRASINRLKPDIDIGTSPPLPYCDPPKLRNSYEMIQTIAERLGAVTGRRKAIIWVNGRVPLDPVDPDECGLLSDADSKGGLTGAQGSSLTFMQRDAMRAATRNNVAIYPIDAVGLTVDPAVTEVSGGGRTPGVQGGDEPATRRMKRLAALRGIAEDTGGEAVVNTNNFSPAFERIVRANSSYYMLAYRPAVDHRDAKFHAITVRLRQPRPGFSVRAKKGYMAPGTDAPVQSRLLPGVSADGGAALVKALPATGLAIRLFLAPFKGGGINGSVVVGAELRGLTGEANAERRVEISYLAIDPQGATRVAPPKILALDLDANAAPLTTGTAVQYIDRLALPPGRHEVRMAIHQPGGATGSVVAHVEVPDFTREPLTMSGLVFASGTTAPVTLQGDALLGDLLGAEPTTARRFARRDSITAAVEVYTDGRTPADQVGVTATLTTGQGAKVRTETVTRVAGDARRSTFTARLPLADLAPGDYVLTMEARADRQTVARQVPFTVD